MLLRQLFDQESSTYTYLVADKNNKKAALIDPVSEKMNDYIRLLSELDLTLVASIDTHTHADHITASGKLREQYNCTTYLGDQAESACVSQALTDGYCIHVGNLKLRAIYTPGHTDDSYCFYLNEDQQGYLFSGDTLLIRGTGRCDFQNGNARDQYQSLFSKLLTLPDNTLVLPGHDYKGWTQSTLEEEKKNNPRLQVGSAEQYVELMSKLNLPNPKLMDVAVPANKACGKTN